MEEDPIQREDKAIESMLPEYTRLNLRQLFWLLKLRNSGIPSELSDSFAGVSQSKISRDLNKIQDTLNTTKLYSIESGKFELSDEVKRINEFSEPLMEFLELLSDQDIGRTIRIGGGGSLLSWLVGNRVEEVRDICRNKANYDGTKIKNIQVSCSPKRNREVLAGVRSGIFDFGLVRKSLLQSWKHGARFVESLDLGIQTYSLIIPRKIISSGAYPSLCKPDTIAKLGDDELADLQLKILDNEFLTTVAADGEFEVQLKTALIDASIQPKIEFAYRSFPQVLPHLHAGSHVAIAPLASLWAHTVPDCVHFPLKLLSEYKRGICMIYNTAHLPKWIDVEKMAEVLRLPES